MELFPMNKTQINKLKIFCPYKDDEDEDVHESRKLFYLEKENKLRNDVNSSNKGGDNV